MFTNSPHDGVSACANSASWTSLQIMFLGSQAARTLPSPVVDQSQLFDSDQRLSASWSQANSLHPSYAVLVLALNHILSKASSTFPICALTSSKAPLSLLIEHVPRFWIVVGTSAKPNAAKRSSQFSGIFNDRLAQWGKRIRFVFCQSVFLCWLSPNV